MKKTYAIFALLIICIGAQITFAQSKQEKDRAAFIRNTHLLEQKPFDPNAEAARSWGFKYVADTKDVSVTLCSDIMKLIPEKKNKFKAELTIQLTFGMAAFKLENPAQKDDEAAAQLAGIESVIKTYKVMLAENPKAQSPGMDELVTKQTNGELKTLVDSANCGKKKK